MKPIRLLFVRTLLFLMLYEVLFSANRHNLFLPDTQWIIVSFESKQCLECEILQRKLYKMQWIFNQEPIYFMAIDLSQKAIFDKSRSFLEQIQLWQSLKDKIQLRQALLLHRHSAKVWEVFLPQHSEAHIEAQIRQAISQKN